MGNYLGLDIGYSNVIGVYGDGETQDTFIRPSQAAPLNEIPGDAGLRAGEVLIDVDGEKWVAFAAPGRVQEGRELHEDYTASNAYKALFKASLLHAAGDTDVIDKLVTGLPVSQSRDEKYVQGVVQMMMGSHQVTPARTITVKEVVVVAQPIGTLTDIYCSTNHGDVVEESVSLIIDPGFFSVDWVLFDHQELVSTSSSSSVKAMSVLLDACNEEIAKDHGGIPGIEKIESALQSGKDYVLLFGRKVELGIYLERAADRVVPTVFTEIKKTLRFLNGRAIDCVVLGGGGASIYERFAKAEFPDSLIIKPQNSVQSNANGFYNLAIS
jgi:plasmid segregation protein ParM